MALLGSILKGGLNLSKRIKQKTFTPIELQKKTLKKLLKKSINTEFGSSYHFNKILEQDSKGENHSLINSFKLYVPIFNYNSIFEHWWKKALRGKSNIAWPGKIKHFALSSGTSEASSKHIPITKEMLKSIQKTGLKQILSLSNFDLDESLFEKGILMLGGSTKLKYNGIYYEGDLSGISAKKIPIWFQHFYKPGNKIAKTIDWENKLEEITLNAHKWDIGYIVGVPAWIQLLIQKIILHHNVQNIHEIWPNLQVFCHGGVSFEPYRKSFEKLLGKPITYIETYLASEGFIAFQSRPDTKSMKMVLNNGIFYEFIPFTDLNFNCDGELIDNPETLLIDEIETDVEYAILMSTNAGTWRYLIGDVIQFTDKALCEIIIKGRIKHYLNLCGEHLSVDNMNKAIQLTANHFNINIVEFTVSGIIYEGMFAHKWFIGSDDHFDENAFKIILDENLKLLNDDYKTERICAIKDVLINKVPVNFFYDWMKENGKIGAQIKFPRVIKNKQLQEWENFINK